MNIAERMPENSSLDGDKNIRIPVVPVRQDSLQVGLPGS